MSYIHASQIITGEDLSIRWSATGSVSSFTDLGVISNYALALTWQTKETIPVDRQFEQTAKIALKGTLNLTALTDRNFEMPDPCVWIEIGLIIRKLANGDRWQWNRTAKYLVTNDAIAQKPDDTIQHQYTLLSQGKIDSERILVPATREVYWQPSSTADLQIMTDFNSVNFIKIL
jgi:hypothetical protein